MRIGRVDRACRLKGGQMIDPQVIDDFFRDLNDFFQADGTLEIVQVPAGEEDSADEVTAEEQAKDEE